jgi:hypothetical protein
MEFFIKQNSELPILKMEVIKDGRTQVHKSFNEDLDNAIIKFSMKDLSNGSSKIVMNNAYITTKNLINPDAPKEYYIFYKWTKRDTNKKGRFMGEFYIENSMGDMVGPISENLYINIV